MSTSYKKLIEYLNKPLPEKQEKEKKKSRNQL